MSFVLSCPSAHPKEEPTMSLSAWMISMFLLGLGALGLCGLFLKACQKI
jgi:hypothetical protein